MYEMSNTQVTYHYGTLSVYIITVFTTDVGAEACDCLSPSILQ